MRVAVEPLARCAAVDFPPGRVIAARCAPHHDPFSLEVQHGIMSAEAANHLSEPRDQARGNACRPVVRDLRCRRELLGVIGHHGSHPSLLFVGRSPCLCRSSVLPQEYQEVCHGNIRAYYLNSCSHLRNFEGFAAIRRTCRVETAGHHSAAYGGKMRHTCGAGPTALRQLWFSARPPAHALQIRRSRAVHPADA